jgi:multicomponent Na+:H+ antiporter subunit G
MMDGLDLLSWALLLNGSFFCVVGGIGIVKFPEFYTRTHAASITDTMGAGLILTGLMIQALMPLVEHGWALLDSPSPNPFLLCFKVALLGIFLLLTSPTSGHALVKAAYAKGVSVDRDSGVSNSRD